MGFNVFDDLSGKEFGYIKVLKFDHMRKAGKDGTHGMSYYLCECKVCGKVRVLPRSNIAHGDHSKHVHHKKGWF